ncbi:maoC dehydratase domain protein [Mycobacterium xenopi 4042]|uniref:MaoC dehydratase domain protein n=1 Tax=Mycobacterium xenopi 4042 TaxID=1299334 RepID=X8DLR8_MYCXE|nr:maoC dehydratase domain protein [Mycobacterium xenopi 3993]EUA68996.1 maoC dehydratase domain protein [Mycobacterium xenopi 4042]
MTADDGFNLSRLGTWTDEREFKVDAERTIAYAEATNDRISAHLDGSLAPRYSRWYQYFRSWARRPCQWYRAI